MRSSKAWVAADEVLLEATSAAVFVSGHDQSTRSMERLAFRPLLAAASTRRGGL